MVPDATDPELVYFELNMSSNVLHLSFSETVDESTLKITEFTLQNAQTGATSMRLLVDGESMIDESGSGDDVSTFNGDGDVIEVRLQALDMNYIKKIRDPC